MNLTPVTLWCHLVVLSDPGNEMYFFQSSAGKPWLGGSAISDPKTHSSTGDDLQGTEVHTLNPHDLWMHRGALNGSPAATTRVPLQNGTF